MDQTFREKAPTVAAQLMHDFDLTLDQTCGLLGNIGRECEGFTILREIGAAPGRGGYGWCQWTGPRAKLFLNWSAAHKLDWRSDGANYSYLRHELQGPYAYAVFHLKETSGIAQATEVFERYFERAGVPAMQDRIRWAEEAKAAYLAVHPAA
jgi:tail lysozyme